VLCNGNDSRFLVTLIHPNGTGVFATCRKLNEAARHDNSI